MKAEWTRFDLGIKHRLRQWHRRFWEEFSKKDIDWGELDLTTPGASRLVHLIRGQGEKNVPQRSLFQVRLLFDRYKLGIGFFWDPKDRRLYIIPLPCLGLVIHFGSVWIPVLGPHYLSPNVTYRQHTYTGEVQLWYESRLADRSSGSLAEFQAASRPPGDDI